MSKLSSEYGSRKSVSSIEPTLENLNELYDAGDYDGIKHAVDNASIKEERRKRNPNPVEVGIKKLLKRSVDDMNIVFFRYLFSCIDEKLFRKSFFSRIVKKGAYSNQRRMLEEISDIVRLTWKDIEDAVISNVDTYAIDFFLVNDYDVHTLDLINAADSSKYGNQSDESKNSLLLTLLYSFFGLSAISIAEKGGRVSEKKMKIISEGEMIDHYPEFYRSLSNPVFTQKGEGVSTYMKTENKKMSKLSSEYGSRKSVSSIEPTLENLNELYEAENYDGITIAIENEINKYAIDSDEDLDYYECVNLAETDLLDNLIPLTTRAIDDMNVEFIEYILSGNTPKSVMKVLRVGVVRSILGNDSEIFINRIQTEIPDVVRIKYKDITEYLIDPYKPFTDHNIEHLINSIDPIKYRNEYYADELLDMLLNLDMELSAVCLARKGIKLTSEKIEVLKIEHPDAYHILDNPIFRLESLERTSVSKTPVHSISKLPVRLPASIKKGSASSQIQNVMNPKTGRQIQVGGPTFLQLQKEGYGYVNNKMSKQ